ncbi:unnamed protein product [Pedinophyceae sp. YPF-701]|nr:unnamed protein product [Pedinophyceae sp. YPF-701]
MMRTAASARAPTSTSRAARCSLPLRSARGTGLPGFRRAGARATAPRVSRRSALRVEARNPTKAPVAFKVRRATVHDLVEVGSVLVREQVNPLGLAAERMWVAVSLSGGQVIGCVQVDPKPTELSPTYMVVSNLVVDRPFRYQGVGKTLLREALASCSERDDVWLVAAPRVAAFFARYGFSVPKTMKEVPSGVYMGRFVGQFIGRLRGDNTVVAMRGRGTRSV